MVPVSNKKKRLTPNDDLANAKRGERLQRVLAAAGIASRRECEKFITDGRVQVNGRTITTLPVWADPDRDRIAVDGRRLVMPRHGRLTHGGIYVIMHKPKNVICTASDPQQRTSVLDLIDLPDHKRARIFPVGRLDADSTGLLMLTNDGELANRLTHPRYKIAKQYRVTLRGRLDHQDVAKLTRGLYLAKPIARKKAPASGAKRAAMTQIKIVARKRDTTHGDRTTLLVTLEEGQNREIRRMLARLDYSVRRLQRVTIGPITLKGLASGQWRMLTTTELHRLRRAAGLEKP